MWRSRGRRVRGFRKARAPVGALPHDTAAVWPSSREREPQKWTDGQGRQDTPSHPAQLSCKYRRRHCAKPSRIDVGVSTSACLRALQAGELRANSNCHSPSSTQRAAARSPLARMGSQRHSIRIPVVTARETNQPLSPHPNGHIPARGRSARRKRLRHRSGPSNSPCQLPLHPPTPHRGPGRRDQLTPQGPRARIMA
jgi:hypothetical protein